MSAPLCLCGCGQPVKPSQTRPIPKRGERLQDGIRWCWYASRACGCRVQGTAGARAGRHVSNFAAANVTKQQHARQRKAAEVKDDVADLTRYGVPRSLAIAILVRVSGRAEQRGYNRAYSHLVAAPRRSRRRAA